MGQTRNKIDERSTDFKESHASARSAPSLSPDLPVHFIGEPSNRVGPPR